MEAAWQRDQIAAGVPDQVEQVRAQQVLFYDPFQASRAIKQLNAGFSFESIVQNNDPDNLGYLGWFPRGVLRFPDQLTRLHALTKVDNLGLGLIVLGLLPQFGWLTGWRRKRRRAKASMGNSASQTPWPMI